MTSNTQTKSTATKPFPNAVTVGSNVTDRNGTELVSSPLRKLVEDYNFFVQKPAENITRLAAIVSEVHHKLSTPDQLQFCNEVGIEHNDLIYRKLLERSSTVYPARPRLAHSQGVIDEMQRMYDSDPPECRLRWILSFGRLLKIRAGKVVGETDIVAFLRTKPEPSEGR